MRKYFICFVFIATILSINLLCLSSSSIESIMKDCAKNALSFSLIYCDEDLRIEEEQFEDRFSLLLTQRIKQTEIHDNRVTYLYYLNQVLCEKNKGNEVKITYYYKQFMKGKQQEIYAKVIFE